MYDQIYHLAKKSSSFEELKKKLKGLSVDALKNGKPYATAAAQLAKDGAHDEVVRWLCELGASPHCVAAAYASVGNVTQVNYYLHEYKVDYSCLAHGYAQAKMHTLAQHYFNTDDPKDSSYIKRRDERINRLNAIATGYALVGDDEQVRKYVKLGASIPEIAYYYSLTGNHTQVARCVTDFGLVDNAKAHVAIIKGYAQAGNHAELKGYLNNAPQLLKSAANNYAKAGHHQHVKWCYEQDPESIGAIISGYAEAGANARVDKYLFLNLLAIRKENPHQLVRSAAYYYALAGHDRQVKLLFNKYSDFEGLYDVILEGYQHAGNRPQFDYYYAKKRPSANAPEKRPIFDLLNTYLSDRNSVPHSSGITKEYFYGSFFSSFQKSFSEKFDAVEALKNALADENVNLKEHLSTLRNGNLGKQLRAFIQAGSADALVGTPVRTVSGFVNALQDKNSQLLGQGL